ncbi:MAG: RES family NAD+ phosphorylase [Methylococcales bacterium]
MFHNTWMPIVVLSEDAFSWKSSAWRMVEAQHIASTMKIVDNADEQDLLELLLEESKPPRPEATKHLHYLLATPFRYSPLRGGSRFRADIDEGVFYGAESVRTASAELGYWRWKFLNDAVDLDKINPVAHTAFKVDIKTLAVDLRKEPFNKDSNLWTHPTDYTATQEFARNARNAEIGVIIYKSVRETIDSWCVAVLTPTAFAKSEPDPQTQTWWLAVYKNQVIWRRDQESITFDTQKW